MDINEQKMLEQIQRDFEQTDPEFAKKFHDRKFRRSSPENREFIGDLKIALLLTAIALAVVLLAAGAAILLAPSRL